MKTNIKYLKKGIITIVLLVGSNLVSNAQTNNAYGDNQVEVEPGVFAIYSGDVNQDGVVEFFDLIEMDNSLTNFDVGYVPTDLTGDGVVEFFDLLLIDNALTSFVAVSKP